MKKALPLRRKQPAGASSSVGSFRFDTDSRNFFNISEPFKFAVLFPALSSLFADCLLIASAIENVDGCCRGTGGGTADQGHGEYRGGLEVAGHDAKTIIELPSASKRR